MKLVNTLYNLEFDLMENQMEHLYPGLPLMGKILLEQAECHS